MLEIVFGISTFFIFMSMSLISLVMLAILHPCIIIAANLFCKAVKQGKQISFSVDVDIK